MLLRFAMIFLRNTRKLIQKAGKVCQIIMYIEYRYKYKIDDLFKFNGDRIIFYGDGDIICGSNSYIGKDSSIQSVKNNQVIIENNCSLSHFVSIYTYNHIADQDFSIDNKSRSGNVTIGKYSWIGIKSTIIGPVNIGQNCVIGANSVVNRDIPPHSIAIGVPAQVVKFKSYISVEEQKELAQKYSYSISTKLKQKLGIS